MNMKINSSFRQSLFALIFSAFFLSYTCQALACVARVSNWPDRPINHSSGANGLMWEKVAAAHAAGNDMMSFPAPFQKIQPAVIILIENSASGVRFHPKASSNALWSKHLEEMNEYFSEISKGNLSLSKAKETYGVVNDGVIGPVQVDGLTQSSRIKKGNSEPLVVKAIQAANKYINFAQYDKNLDGAITADELHILIYQCGDEAAFYGESDSLETPNAWMHMKWRSSMLVGLNPVSDSDGKRITSYCYCGSTFGLESVIGSNPKIATIGPMVHEIGHDLGLPDLSDCDGNLSGGDWNGLGNHCMMSHGYWCGYYGSQPTHLNGYLKWWLGWANLMVLSDGNEIVKVVQSVGTNQTFRISVRNSNQFFLIENRQLVGYDKSIGGNSLGGLAIYHCDDRILNDEQRWTQSSINNSRSRPGIMLEQAAGASLYNASDYGSSKDYFRGSYRTTFDETILPDISPYGDPTNVSICDVSVSGEYMTFYLGKPEGLIVTLFQLNWGSYNTMVREVIIQSAYPPQASPKYYQIWENTTVPSNLPWIELSNFYPQTYKLSAGNGIKWVHFRVKDANGNISLPVGAPPINLAEPMDLVTNGPTVPGKIESCLDTDFFHFLSNGGKYTIETQSGTLQHGRMFLMRPDSPGDNSVSNDNPNQPMPVIKKVLESGSYYVGFKGKTVNDQGDYKIRVIQLRVNSLKINNGDGLTMSRRVRLNNASSGSPVTYRAYEEGGRNDSGWLPYSDSPAYTLSTGNGEKRVYLSVKDEAGSISDAMRATVILNEARELHVNGTALQGSISFPPPLNANHYYFTAESPALYMIEIGNYQGGLQGVTVNLSGPNDQSSLITPNAAGYMLQPGLYNITVIGHLVPIGHLDPEHLTYGGGTYNIMVKR